ncbi:aminotransferase-like domain-containing protein [Pedobacter nyackensis]|uniref:GntR family transcriptional regulator / MocR family aminotransferase n=1 Tax=Pedobacter nyackensis TaxID=475255 RepID=A0A1W2F035_9SPHI|nr:PLP-dependent aminotransferase family protein [Pedobacter nyackensis]SMD15281.1 GntR family transcriptional regulator / MocR family aminotransferase [Pedobacter nyackensis]
MDGPVQIPFKSFIQLKPDETTAIYLQIVFEFIKAIQLGLLPEGTKLPGTRILCRLLVVNRNTLIKAFQDLEAQGFIEILPNKGTFILSDQKKKNTNEAVPGKKKLEIPASFTFKHSSILENPVEVSDLALQFNDGLPDLRLVHTDVLARLYVSKLKRQKAKRTWEQIQTQSHLTFKKQFSNFLNLTRGLRISESNLLTTTSHEISLYLVTKLLISAGDKVVVAAPGYYLSNMTLSDSGAHIIPVPIDDEGINTAYLRKVCEEHTIRILYLTSNYHYPTTIPLSAKRRMEVLELATLYGFIILEDDYDFDFHYDNNPILPLAAFDSHERVVYVGSFARSLPVGFGYGFVAAPIAFIKELEKHQNILEPGIDVIKEQVLTDWIQDGEVHRLSKKNRKIYKERRDYFAFLLTEKLKGRIKFNIPPRGLAIWVQWLDKFNLVKFQEKCAANGLFLPKTILYQTKSFTATRLGFGNLDKKEMEDAVAILGSALEALIPSRIAEISGAPLYSLKKQ